MINQINLFTNPKSDAEIRFVKLNDKSIAPKQDKDGNWIMFASEDILLRSDYASPLYCGLSMFIDDENINVDIICLHNDFYKPRGGNVTICHGHNENEHIGMYIVTKAKAQEKEIEYSGLFDLEHKNQQSKYETIMEKRVQVSDGTFENYHIEVPKNSVLVKRGTPIFLVQAYRKVNIIMVEDFIKKTVYKSN